MGKRQLKHRPVQNLRKDRKYFLENNLWLIPILTIFSGCWFPIVINMYGITLKLMIVVNNEKELTLQGWLFTIIIFALPIIFATIKSTQGRSISNDIYIARAERDLHTCILESLQEVGDFKLGLILRRIQRTSSPEEFRACSEDVLCNIMTQMASCIAFLLTSNNHRVSSAELSINIIYSYDGRTNWKFCGNCTRGLSDEVICEQGSTLMHLVDRREDSVFYNDKNKAIEDCVYIIDGKDRKDNSGKYLGSIAGYKIKILNNSSHNVVAALFISSYIKPFVPTECNDVKTIENMISNVKYNFEEIIIKNFSRYIKAELSTLAIYR